MKQPDQHFGLNQKKGLNISAEALPVPSPDSYREGSNRHISTCEFNLIQPKQYYGLSQKKGLSISAEALPVPRAGLEPAHLSILVFETNASTNSATWAIKLKAKFVAPLSKRSAKIDNAFLFRQSIF